MKGTAKRLMVLVGMLTLMLTTAVVPAALAQEQEAQYGGEEITATGVLRDGLPADVGGIGTHSITDDATGELYALRSAGADLDSYTGQQVTVYGALTPGEEGSGEGEFGGNGTLPSIDVTRVEPADDPSEVEETSVTGVVENLGPTQEGGGDIYGIFGGDEIQGYYYLEGDVVDFGPLVGQSVTAYGTLETSDEGATILNVSRVEPADECEALSETPDLCGTETITATYELAVECEPPAGTTFYGFAGQQPVELADPDGNGAYTGTLTLPDDFYANGPFPMPVWIRTGMPEDPRNLIEDFDKVVIEDGDLFSAGVSCDSGSGGKDGGSDGSGDKGSESPVKSGDNVPSTVKVLPSTGGILPIAGLAGLLIIAGGLTVRRITR